MGTEPTTWKRQLVSTGKTAFELVRSDAIRRVQLATVHIRVRIIRPSAMRADRDEMTHITEARVIGNHAAMGRSTPAATDRPYLTVGEVLRAGIRRAAERKDMAGANSAGDSEGGATEQRSTPGGAGG